jgi:Flp pilus assembly protein TadG
MRRPGDDRGAATTEVVLLTPVLLFLVLVIVQFGLWYHAQHVANAAAEQGLDSASANGGTADGGRQRAEEFLEGAAPTLIEDAVVTSSRESDIATVEVRGIAVALIPGLTLTVSAETSSPVERFYEDDRVP